MSHFDPFESQCVRFTKARLAPLRTQKSSGNEAFALRLTTLNARQARYATVCSTLTLLQLEQIAFSIWTVLNDSGFCYHVYASRARVSTRT